MMNFNWVPALIPGAHASPEPQEALLQGSAALMRELAPRLLWKSKRNSQRQPTRRA
jgi:hypothetical protein